MWRAAGLEGRGGALRVAHERGRELGAVVERQEARGKERLERVKLEVGRRQCGAGERKGAGGVGDWRE